MSCTNLIGLIQAGLQVDRIAEERGIFTGHTEGHGLGCMGEPSANALGANSALRESYPGG